LDGKASGIPIPFGQAGALANLLKLNKLIQNPAEIKSLELHKIFFSSTLT
jgi:hypothetical protein